MRTLHCKYLTDAAVEITTPEGIVVLDLGEYTPAELVSPGVLAAVSSHQHSDHCDRPALATLGIPVWAPADTVPLLMADGVSVATALVPGKPARIAPSLTVTAYPVRHGLNSKPIDNYGLLVEVDGFRIWHCGDIGVDTTPHPPGRLDLVLVPVGGTYVFDAEAAAAYVDALGHGGEVVPIHYDYAPDQGLSFAANADGRTWTTRLIPTGEPFTIRKED